MPAKITKFHRTVVETGLRNRDIMDGLNGVANGARLIRCDVGGASVTMVFEIAEVAK
jgi:hypothetical protein